MVFGSRINVNGSWYQFPKLWDWQVNAFTFATKQEAYGVHNLVQAPMGAGKSRLALAIAYNWLKENNRNRVVISAPSLILQYQLYKIFKHNCTVPAYLDNARYARVTGARIIITTHATLGRWVKEPNMKHDILLFDECHHDNLYAESNRYKSSQFPTAFGFSASPWSALCDKYYPRKHVYGLNRAIEDKVICPYRIHSETPMEPRRYAIEYLPTTEYCDLTYETENPRTILDAWKRGKINPIRVCGMLTEGFDSIQTFDVILSKQIKSPIFAYQAAGRAFRYLFGKTADIWGVVGETKHALDRAIWLANP